jgi:hypothetical protein
MIKQKNYYNTVKKDIQITRKLLVDFFAKHLRNNSGI